MAADDLEVLQADLRSLGRAIAVPDPDATVDTVLARLAAEPSRQSSWRTDADRFGLWIRARWRSVVALVAAVLLVLVLATPVGAAVARWFGLGGVDVTQLPARPSFSVSASAVPQAEGDLTFGQAATLVGFAPVLPTALGVPAAIEVSADRRVLSMSWSGGADGEVRLDQFDGELSPVFMKKYYDGLEFTTVDGAEALWFAEPHELMYVDPHGQPRTATARMAAQTLVWQRDGVTLRLEGDLTKDRAIQIAEST